MAYYKCVNITNIVVHPLIPPNASSAFYGIPLSVPIYVHLSAFSAYMSDSTWSEYKSRLKSIEEGVFITTPNDFQMSFNTSSLISVPYVSTYSGTPTISVVSSNTDIVTISGVTVTESAINFTATSMAIEGSAIITATMTLNDTTCTSTFMINVGDLIPCSYSVEDVDGATYNFVLNEDGYYESTNNGVDKSYSICKVNITTDGISNVYFDCINSAENNYDFGILSNIDSTLTLGYTADSTNVFKSFKGASSTSVQTVNYGVLTEGTHYIYVKFIKDVSSSSGNDSLQFKVRFE